MNDMLTGLKAEAQGQVSRYPQYANHFTDYVLVKAKKTIKTKMGVAVEKGELTIARPEIEPPDQYSRMQKPTRTIWSFRNGIDTSVHAENVEVIASH